MRFAVLGPLEVTTGDGRPVDVGGRQPRLVLAALVVAAGRPVSASSLIEAVWGEHPPASAAGTLHSYVSRLRRALDEGGGPRLVHDDGAYRLDLEGHVVDVDRFGALVAEGHELLVAGQPLQARAVLVEALDSWRGPALVDLVDQGVAIARAAALDEQRAAALEDRLDADLALGRHTHVIGELQELTEEYPLREGLHVRLALAMYRAGRQADALRVLAAAGRQLREELGLEPGAALRELESSILLQDPRLDAPAVASVADVVEPDSDEVSPFVGRDMELADLLAARKEAVDAARFVVIEGEPGIGKTRLASELVRAAADRGSQVFWGRTHEGGAAPALWPWLQVLRAAVEDASDDIVPVVADLLAGTAPLLPGQGGAVQFEHFDAIATLLERAGAASPVVVCIDDLQWADSASLDLLHFLTTRLGPGVFVVATLRQTALEHPPAVTAVLGAIARRDGSRRLRLHGLSESATGALLESLAAGEVDPAATAGIHARAEGNPFYAIELARLLADEGQRDDVPATVRDAIRRRLALLPEETVDVLAVAATTGRDVELPLVARAADIDLERCFDLVDPAAAHLLLVESPHVPGLLRFSHALVREVLLEGLTPVRRARLHLRVADALAGEHGDHAVGSDVAELFADHLWHAASLGVGDRAANALERAAEIAVSRVAYTAAEESLTRAARLRRAGSRNAAGERAELDTLLRLLEVMQTTRYFSGTDRDALHRARDLAERLGEHDVSRNLAWSEWAAMSTAGRVAESRPLARQYLERWGADVRPQVAGGAHTLFGVDEWSRGRITSALEHLGRAVELFEGGPPPADAFEAEHRLVALGFGLFCQAAHGDLPAPAALDVFEAAIAELPPVAVPAACMFAGAVAAVHGRFDRLERLIAHAVEVDPSSQFAFFGGQMLMFRGLIAATRGDLDEAIATFVEGRHRYRGVGGRSGTSSYQALLGELLARAGRVNDAAELISGARRQLDDSGDGWNEVTVAVAEGVLAHAAGDSDRAAERFRSAISTGREQGALALAERAADVAAGLGVLT